MTSGLSKWLVAICVIFGTAMGYGIAAVSMSFWSVFSGAATPRGLFILVWLMASLVMVSWPMHIALRAQAVRRQRKILHDRVGDLDFEPPSLPFITARAPESQGGLVIKAPDIEQPRLQRFLSRGRTAEQRMADYMMTLEIQTEIQRAQELKERDQPELGPLD